MKPNAILSQLARNSAAIAMATAGGAAALMASGASAQEALPIFTCENGTSTGANVYRSSEIASVFNTYGISATDRGNQPRWQHAGTRLSSGTTLTDDLGGLGLGGPTAWPYFTGLETSSYTEAQSLERIGFYPRQAGAVNNQFSFFNYAFTLAPEVDTETLVLNLQNFRADDAVTAVYINGVKWGGAFPANGLSQPLVSLALDPAQSAGTLAWQQGRNDITFVIYDTISSGTWLTLQGASFGACETRATQASVDVQPVPSLGMAGTVLLSALTAAAAGLRRNRRKA